MLKTVLKVVGALIAVFVAVGVFLPSTYKVARSTTIKAPAGLVFELINNLKMSESWSPWGEGDASMKITYSGPAAGVGAKGAWTSKDSGVGNQTITKSEPNSLVEIALDFGDQGQGSAAYQLEPEGEALKVTWSMQGDVGFSLVGRYFALGMDSMLAPYFEKGLAKLKQVSERKAAEAAKQFMAIMAAAAKAKEPIRVGGLQTPESVLYDAIGDVYLVSNINGSPFDADDNGFLMKIGPDGSVLEERWIDGASEAVTLNAPKGMAIAGDVLYVSDINVVRMFDRATGAPKGEIKVAGASFLNDVAAGPDGVVYVSDSGMKAGFAPSGTDAIYKLVDGNAVVVLKDKELGRPNGLLVTADGIWVVTFGSGELFLIDATGQKTRVQKLATGSLDGIVQLDNGNLAISSWEGSSVLSGAAGGDFSPIVSDAKSPADIGYDTKRNRLLIPHFQDNLVLIKPL